MLARALIPAESRGTLHDACMMVDESNPEVPVDAVLEPTYKNDLLAPGQSWTEGSEFSISSFD